MTWQTCFRAPRAETIGVSYVPKMLVCPTFYRVLRSLRPLCAKNFGVPYVPNVSYILKKLT